MRGWRYRSRVRLWIGAWICEDCGCLVEDRETHDEWHDTIARLAVRQVREVTR